MKLYKMNNRTHTPKLVSTIAFVFAMAFCNLGQAQLSTLEVRFANPTFACGTDEYCLDVEFRSDNPGDTLFGMNVRFFYDDAYMEIISMSDFQGGYGALGPNPGTVVTSLPNFGTDYFGYPPPGEVDFVNAAVQLLDEGAPALPLDDVVWTKLFQICFTIEGPIDDSTNFCPPIVWDLQQDPSMGGYLSGDDGVVMTTTAPPPAMSEPALEQVVQFNWQYIGDGSTQPYGEPIETDCISLFCEPVITCVPDITIECFESTDPANTGMATATDICITDVTISFDDTTIEQTCDNDYVFSRRWIATNECSFADTCFQIITVIDTTAPTLVCPPFITISCDDSTDPADTGMASATDLCDPNPTVTYLDVPKDGPCPQSYTIDRIWSGFDECGNTTIFCRQEITILDMSPPDITCPADLTLECDDPIPTDLATATDNCSPTNTITIEYVDIVCDNPIMGFTEEYEFANWTIINPDGGDVIPMGDTEVMMESPNGNIPCPTGASVLFEIVVPSTGQIVFDWNFATMDVNGPLYDPFGYNLDGTFYQLTDDDGPNMQSGTAAVDVTAGQVFALEQNSIDCILGPATTTVVEFFACREQMEETCSQLIIRAHSAADECDNSAVCIQTIYISDFTDPGIVCPADVTIECDELTDPSNTGMASATDNCDTTPEITYADVTITPGVCPQEYIITRRWTATDACGNTDSCDQIITVDDSVPPTITFCPADVTIECDEDTDPLNTGFATATDNCDTAPLVTYSDVTLAGACPQEYTITRTWSATDICGNTSTCVQVIEVDDSVPPTITFCPVGVTIECDESTDPANTGLATATDNCDTAPIVSYTDVTLAGACPQEYTITRTWTATDACGNTSTCDQVIEIEDTTPPSITFCPSDITVECDESTDPANTGLATATDNCDTAPIVSYTDVTVAGACPQEYTITRTWTATDACGNGTNCVQTIIVDDSTPPTITCPVDLTLECTDPIPTDLATATDNCSSTIVITYSDIMCDNPVVGFNGPYDIGLWTTILPPEGGDVEVMGDSEVMLTSPDITLGCDDVSVQFSINVTSTGQIVFDWHYETVDVDGPFFDPFGYSLNGNFIQLTDDDGNDIQSGTATVAVTAGDVFAFDQRSTDCGFGEGATTVVEFFACIEQADEVCTQLIIRTHTATDECDNESSCVQTIFIEDTVAPEITCAADVTIECDESTDPANTGMTSATDACDPTPDISYTDVTIASQVCVQEYTIERTWTVADNCGNTTTCLQVITVDDSTPPVITCPAGLTIECDESTDPINTGMASATDNCDPAPVVTYNDVTLAGACPQEYTITRTWTATDACGNTSTCDQVIEIEDTTPPTITFCPSDITIECDESTDPANTGMATATDNCDAAPIVSYTDVTVAGACPQEYTITRTWTATDACGNGTNCIQTIIVDDSTPPTITCPVDLTLECTDPIPTDLATATDNCSSTIVITYSDIMCDNPVVGFNGPYDIGLWTTILPPEGGDVEVMGDSEVMLTSPDITIGCDDVSVQFSINVTSTGQIVFDWHYETVDVDGPFFDPFGYSLNGNFIQLTDDNGNDIQSGTATVAVTAGDVFAFDQRSTDCGFGEGATTVVEFFACIEQDDEVCTQLIIRTHTATDECDNTSSCVQTIFIEDTVAPEITCAADVTIECDESTDPANTGMTSATDACDPTPDISYTDVTIASQICVQEYTIERTWTATDNCGNTTTCLQVITVDDSTPPVITCPASLTIECDESTDPANTGLATATDNCDTAPVISYSDVTLAGACPQEYTITRTWTATDACGNSSTCDQVIEVDDSLPPTFTFCPTDVTVECDESTDPADLGMATATDNCDSAPIVSYTDVTVAGECPQEYTITRTWTATDECGNGTNCVQVITVDDSTPPALLCPDDVTLECDQSTAPEDIPYHTIYFDNQDLYLAASDPLTLESFEGLPITGTYVNALTLPDFEMTSTTDLRVWDMPVSGRHATDGVQFVGISGQAVEANTTTYTFNAPINAFGINITDWGDSGMGELTFMNDQGDSFVVAVSPAGDGNEQFFGVINTDMNFTTVMFESTSDDAYGVDELYYGITIFNGIPPEGGALAVDNCDPAPSVSYTDVTIAGNCPQEYNIERTWTATDACGNETICLQVLTIKDTQAPSFTFCPVDVTIECDESTEPDNTGLATATDNCDGALVMTYSDVIEPGACPQEYTITRTWIATDACGNQTCLSGINFVDRILTSSADFSGSETFIGFEGFAHHEQILEQYAPQGVHFDANSQTEPKIWNNDGAPEGIAYLNNFDGSIGQPVEVTFDEKQNRFGIMVRTNTDDDAQLEIICMLENEVIGVETFTTDPNWSFVGFESEQGFDQIIYTGVGSANGTMHIDAMRFEGDDCCVQIIKVEDTTAPVLVCAPDVTIECDESTLPGNTGSSTATDNCSDSPIVLFSDVTIAGDCPQEFTITRTWVAFDECGNVSSCEQTVVVDDSVAPDITCPADITIDCNESTSPDNTGEASATDNCDDSLPEVTYTDVTIEDGCPEIIERTWSVTDACGNTGTCVQLITIDDTTPPVIICPGDVTVECASDVPDILTGGVTVSDDCGFVTVTHVGDFVSDSLCINQFTISRVYMATDECDNTATCTQVIEVDDQTPPVIACPGDITVDCAEDIPTPDIGSVSATDNCEGEVVIEHINDVTISFTCENQFTVIRTYSATDACGNSSTCSQTITVFDDIAPVITCPDDITVECAGEVPPVDTGAPTAIDNCTTGPVTIGWIGDVITEQECAHRFTIERTYQATDACGNSASCIQTITVFDETPPTIECPPNLTITFGDSESPDNTGLPTADDNCGPVATVTFSDEIIPGPCDEEYTIIRTWTATDSCGLSSTCDQEIFVDGDCIVDLALTKELLHPAEVDGGDEVFFRITILNEGEVTISSVGIIDYIPLGFSLFDPAWTPGTDGSTGQSATVTLSIANGGLDANGLNPGEFVITYIRLIADDDVEAGYYFNCAEILFMLDLNGMDVSDEDIDSTPDNDDTNDLADEDDFDCAPICVLPDSEIVGDGYVCPSELVTYFVTEYNPDFTYVWELNGGGEIVQDNGSDIDIQWQEEPGGPFELRVTVILGDGCSMTAFLNVYIQGVDEIACNDHIQISLDENCEAVILSGIILEGENEGNNNYYVQITDQDGNIIPDATLNEEHIGQIFNVMVLNECNGQSCWGTISVEDKIPPVIECTDVTLSCGTDLTPIYDDLQEGTEVASIFPDLPIGPNGGTITTANLAVNVPANAVITDVNVTIDLNHTWVGDLTAELISPSGTSVLLVDQLCGSVDNWEQVEFDDEAGLSVVTACSPVPPALEGSLIPEGVLADMDGETAVGDWTVMITDNVGGDGGTLNEVTLEVSYYVAEPVAPFTSDACGEVELTYTEIESGDACDQSILTRYWTATDESGNTSTCVQTITITPLSLDLVEFPPAYVGECGESIFPDNTGWPTIDGQPITDDSDFCNIFVGYWDDNLNDCGGGRKIARTWTVLDWCAVEVIEAVQVIKLSDNEGPELTCPDDMNVGTDFWYCYANVSVPKPEAIDECSEIASYELSSTNGIVVNFGNNFVINGMELGTHTATWTVTDECGNSSTCSFQITVVDDVVPVANCDSHTTVSLTNDGPGGVTLVPATVFDDGSYDNCGPVTFRARRMDSCIDWDWTTEGACIDDVPGGIPPVNSRDRGTVHRPCVPFACCDVAADEPIMVELEVEDAAGNKNYCMVEVTVQDKISPFIECPPDIIVSCDFWFNVEEGTFVDGEGNNDGSLDEDPLSPVFGNMYDAFRYDESVRQDIVINDPGNEDYTPQPYNWGIEGWADDNCEVNLSVRVRVIDDCSGDDLPGNAPDGAIKMIERRFSASDGNPGVAPGVCTQRIWVVDYEPFYIDDEDCNNRDPQDGVIWPCDVLLTSCPEDLGNTGEPVIFDDACSLIGVTYEDTRFDFVDGACFKILRRWSVIDWCQYDSQSGEGLWNYTQVIKVHDEEGPEFVEPCETVVLCVEDEGVSLPDNNQAFLGENDPLSSSCSAHLNLSRVVHETCSDEVQFDVKIYPFNGTEYILVKATSTATVDSNNNATLTFDTRQSTIQDIRKNGIPYNSQFCGDYHRILWSVEDGCGNWSHCEYLFRLEDCKQPSPVCINGLSTVVMPIGGEVTVWAKDFNASSFDDCTPSAELLYSFSGDAYEPSYTFTCDNVPAFNVELSQQIWVADGGTDDNCNGQIEWSERNKDFCTTTIVITDNSGACGDGSILAGDVLTEHDDAVGEVGVLLSSPGHVFPMYVTSENGHFEFIGVPLGEDYEITPERNDDHRNGVSTLDLVRIQKHLLGKEPFTSPYQYIAADANNSESISAIDLIEIRKLILGVYSEFPANQSWRFVEKGYDMDEEHPWPFSEIIQLPALADDSLMNNDFVGVKIGDVNNTAKANAYQILPRSGRRVLHVELDAEAKVEAGDIIDVKLVLPENVEGFQWTLETQGLTYAGVSSESMNINDSHVGVLNDGIVTMSWNQEGSAEEGVSQVIELQFVANTSGNVGSMVQMTSKVTEAEAYTAEGEILDVKLGQTIEAAEFALYQNTPNPWNDQTTIGFDLPEDASVTFTVFDATGKIVKTVRGDYVKGYNTITLNAKDIPTAGVMYYRLESGSYSASKKMVLVK